MKMLSQTEYDTLILDMVLMEKESAGSSEGSEQEDKLFGAGSTDQIEKWIELQEIVNRNKKRKKLPVGK
mgnify:CR=1 FL=1